MGNLQGRRLDTFPGCPVAYDRGKGSWSSPQALKFEERKSKVGQGEREAGGRGDEAHGPSPALLWECGRQLIPPALELDSPGAQPGSSLSPAV